MKHKDNKVTFIKTILILLLSVFSLSGYSQHIYYTGTDNYAFQTKYVIDKEKNVIPVRKDTFSMDEKIIISINKDYFYLNDGTFNLYKILKIEKTPNKIIYTVRDYLFETYHIFIENDNYLSILKYNKKAEFIHYTTIEWNIKKTN